MRRRAVTQLFAARLVLPAIALTLASGCASLGATNDDALDVVVAAARGAAAVDTVWPGYRPFERGFIVFVPGSGAWLTTDHAPPAPWIAITSSEPRLRDRLYHRSSDLPGLTGGIDTGYRVGDRTYPAVQAEGDASSTLVTLYHEAFHTWQDSSFAIAKGEFVPADATVAPTIAMIELERRILAASLEAGSDARADSLVAAFLAVRSARMSAASETVRTVDRMLERLEGIAHLVGFQTAAAALGREPERVHAAIVATLEADLAEHAVDPANRYYRWRAYGTGAAIGLQLDRLGMSWRTQAAAGTPLDSLLLRAARIAPSPSLVTAAREQFGYDDLLRATEHIAPAAGADPIAEFLALEPHRLVIEIVADTAFAPSISFDPGTAGFETPAPSLTLLPRSPRASMTGAGFDLSLTHRPVMIDGRNAPIMRLVVLLPAAAQVNDAAATTVAGPLEGTLRITGRGTELVMPGSNVESISVEPNAVVLRVRTP